MAKLTSKYQLTLPKAVAQRAGLKPGDDVDCESSDEMVRIKRKAKSTMRPYSKTDRLVLFDLATVPMRSPVVGRAMNCTSDDSVVVDRYKHPRVPVRS
jgi:AbrB family looped-hinge helix DNA binding protein